MKAIVYRRYGTPDVLECAETEKPTPEDDEVLIKVRAASVNPLDRHIMRGKPFLLRMAFGLRRPRMRPGRDVAGQVEAVGRKVTQFKPGDEVFGACSGALAEYACTRESALVAKPNNVTFEQAASVPVAGLTALQGLRDKGKIRPGQKVLINGAGGGVGTFAVQIAKSFGARVTAVTNSANLDMVRKLGADQVIDYTQEDYTKKGEAYDLIVEIGASHSISDYKRIMNPNGTFVLVGFKDKIVRRLLYFIIRSRFASRGDKKFTFFIAKSNHADLVVLKDLIERGD